MKLPPAKVDRTTLSLKALRKLSSDVNSESYTAVAIRQGPGFGVTATVRIVLRDSIPLLPDIVIERLPVPTDDSTLTDISELAELPLGGVTVLGAKLTVMPLGWPVAVNDTGSLKPPTEAIDIDAVADSPCLMLRLDGETEIVKSGGSFTTTVTDPETLHGLPSES